MSYPYQSNYPQHPPPPQQSPPQGYHDPRQQYAQSVQNGGYPGQYGHQLPLSQHQYAGGQLQYQSAAGGGPVQHPQAGTYQDGHSSPRGGSLGGQSYSNAPYQYNPSQYSPQPPQHQMQQVQMPTYNPQAYANVNQTPYPQQNTPALPNAPFGSVSGPVDPYTYSPGVYAASTYSSSSFSPQTPYNAQNSTFASHTAANPSGYMSHASPQVPEHGHVYQPPTAMPMPMPDTYRPQGNSAFPPRTSSSPMPGLAENERWAPSPPYGYNENRGSPSPLYQMSPPSSTAGPTPPAHGPSRTDTLNRHPTNRPLPVEPDYFPPSLGSRVQARANDEGSTQDELYKQVEDALHITGGSPLASTHRPSISISQPPIDHTSRNSPMFSTKRESQHSRNGDANGHLSPTGPSQGGGDVQYSSDSDAEAAQGLAMMRMADEDDARRQSGGTPMRFSSYGSQRDSRQNRAHDGDDSDDYAQVDMSSFGGGYDVQMTYGGDPSQLAAGGQSNGDASSQPISSQHSSMRQSHASQSSRGELDYHMDSVHPFPPFTAPARVDAGGTGGLSEPTGRRQSFDEGDEYAFMEGGTGGLPERFPDEPLNIGEFHPASAVFRPLPAPPYQENSMAPLQTDFRTLPPTPDQSGFPGTYVANGQSQYVPRSSSLVTHSNTPLVSQPLRSKTAAEEYKRRQAQIRGSAYPSHDSTPATSSMLVDLPAIGKRFAPSKLGAPDYKKCTEPWSLMSLMKWLLEVTNPEQNTELKEGDIKEALVALFTSKVPTMNIADAETLSIRVVLDMYQAGTLVTTEEWVKIVPGPISGVIFQLTQGGCYSPTVHDHVIPNMRCYSRLCQRTLKKVSLLAQTKRTNESWAEFYGLKKEDFEHKDSKELEIQYNLHEIVSSEEGFMESLDTLRTLYRDQLASIEPSVLPPKSKDKFLHEVFGRVDAVKQANEDHLLPQLKYRQQEQGPWIVGYSDIFRQWIRKAKSAYIEYAGAFPRADHLVRREMDRNMEFRNFVERARRDERSNRLSLDSFLKAPITRLQRYTLLINTVLKNMKKESQERRDLKIALEEVKNVTLECDHRVAETRRKMDLLDLETQLVLRPHMTKEVELNLNHFGRELIHRGDLQRMGSTRFTWLDCHALLFDHYLVLSKIIAHPPEQGGRLERYDVSRMPIPMDLLILESANEPSVQKSSYVKGITTVTTVSGRTSTPADQNLLGRTSSNQSPGPTGLAHVNTGSSMNSLQTVGTLGDNKESDRILYPFKVKHLGRETYTLFAHTEAARRDWCVKIVEAKTKHAAALHAQHAEPFRLRVMADSAFVMEGYSAVGRGVVIKGTPVDRAIREVEHRFKDTGRPGPVCRARVNCATTFTTPHPSKQMIAVGTDYGVFISEVDNPRGWNKAITAGRVTQVFVLEDFNLFLLISDKQLNAYHLDVVCTNERNGTSISNDSSRKAPQRLSGSKDVGFFVTGKMKDRTLVFYKKKDGMNSVFRVLEPVYQKSTEKKRGIFKRGQTEFFREYDEFYIPAESSGMNLFHSSLAVSTARGFEVLTLDKKQPWSVPELKAEAVQDIANSIKDQKALSMLRLSDQEFLLCYERNAVYVNKHGDVSRSVIMNFVGMNAQAAALYGPYLVLFNEDFVEVRNAQNGRLKQIIAGREVKCLDDGSSWSASSSGSPVEKEKPNGMSMNAPRTLKLVMQHPEMEKTQIVVELLLNENMKE